MKRYCRRTFNLSRLHVCLLWFSALIRNRHAQSSRPRRLPPPQNEKAPAIDRSPSIGFAQRLLLESGLDGAQLGVQGRAEALHDRDDRDRDAGGDEAVFDGGCSRLILGKALYEVRHIELHW